MAAAIIFIGRHQCKNWAHPKEDTDLKKQLTDFIIYQERSLTWFAFNLVCCVLPPIVVILVLTNIRTPEDKEAFSMTKSEIVLSCLIALQWLGHIL